MVLIGVLWTQKCFIIVNLRITFSSNLLFKRNIKKKHFSIHKEKHQIKIRIMKNNEIKMQIIEIRPNKILFKIWK